MFPCPEYQTNRPLTSRPDSARLLRVVRRTHSDPERIIMLGTVLVILLVLMLLGALPSWPHSRNWGYYPSGGLGLVLAIVVVLLLLGRI
jgi:hypothetical protein